LSLLLLLHVLHLLWLLHLPCHLSDAPRGLKLTRYYLKKPKSSWNLRLQALRRLQREMKCAGQHVTRAGLPQAVCGKSNFF
jgi:hypothetical protein